MAGAEVIGYALKPPDGQSLYKLAGIDKDINAVYEDIRDLDKLKNIFNEANPEIVLHLAAQPLVRESYHDPVYTYETNIMGAVNILECVRQSDTVKSFLNVTTDKVYKNKEWCWGYRENEDLDGYDPYSNSKSCSELVTHSYKNSFFREGKVAISTARAGNVIGGGDFSCDRIIPDCIRAVQSGEAIKVRNPHSIRPYQHVLEPLFAYLMIAAYQYDNNRYSGYYNVGPDECDCLTTGELVDKFCTCWGNHLTWYDCSENDALHEDYYLKLDCSKIKSTFGWQPRWHIDDAIEKIVEWTRCWLNSGDVNKCMEEQIKSYIGNGVY